MDEQQILKELNKKDWYFQGFNGTPSLLYGPAFSMVRDMPKALGFGYSACIEYFKNDVCYYLYAWEDLHRVGNELFERYKKDDSYLDYLVTENEQICREVMSSYNKMIQKELSTLSVEELFELWIQADRQYGYLLGVSHIVEGFTLTTEEKIREYIKNEFPHEHIEKTIVLTTPSLHSFLSTEHYELCKIVKEIKQSGLDKDNFSKDQNILEKINNHQKKYYWKSNSYTSAKILNVDDFVREISELLSKNNFQKTIDEYESLSDILKQKEEAFSNMTNSELKDLLKIQDIIFQIHDRRKECMTQAVHYLDLIMGEISRRFFVPLSDLRYIRTSELNQLPDISVELSHRRRDGSLYILLPGEQQIIMTGQEAREYFDSVHTENVEEDISEIRGNCASPGKVRGVVKVCRGESELSKVEEGDILVACMTQPEFLPAMKKASAIITDEGGLTCHAAIVARELKKPCVIGTKNATKVFKDGDFVEVDATNGIVKKI